MNRLNEHLLESHPDTNKTRKVKYRREKGIENRSFDYSTESSLTESRPTRITVEQVEVYRGSTQAETSKPPVPKPRSKIPQLLKPPPSAEVPTSSSAAPAKPKRRIQKDRDVEGAIVEGSRKPGEDIPLTTFAIEEKPRPKSRKVNPPQTTHDQESSTTTTTSKTTSSTTEDLSSSTDQQNKRAETPREAHKRKKKKSLLERVKSHSRSVDSEENPADHPSSSSSSIGIYIHDLAFLKFRSDLEAIHIRVSCYDESNGHLLSHRRRGENSPAEIAVLISKKCRFESVNYLHCIWEELLLIEENVRVLRQETAIVFFEIIAKLTSSAEFRPLAWAFLKPFAKDKFDNFEKLLKLQVFYFQSSLSLFQNWRNTKRHRKYPSTLAVTLKSVNQVKSTEDQENGKEEKVDEDGRNNQNPFDVSSVWTNKNFKCPNEVYSSLKLPGKGTNLIQINSTDDLLAIANPMNAEHQIILATSPAMKVVQRLEGHTDYIYGLDWKPRTDYPQVLISCSADYSVFVWTIAKNHHYSVQIIPHLTFMYCCRFWVHHGRELILVAGKDSIIRAWTAAKGSFRNYQEFSKGTGYFTSLIVARNSNVYSGDSEGRVLEWSWNESAFHLSRSIFEEKTGISHLEFHPRIEKIYVGNLRGVIQSIDLETRLVIQRYQMGYLEPQQFFRFRISNCGTFLIAIAASHGISCWNILTNQEVNLSDVIPSSLAGVFSSIELPKRGSLVLLGRYLTNKNALIVLHNSTSSVIKAERSIDQQELPMPLPPPEDPEKIAVRNKLSEIIQKLDQVFGLPRLCDDEKISLINEKNRIEEWLVRSASTTQKAEESDAKSDGTFTVEKEVKQEVVEGDQIPAKKRTKVREFKEGKGKKSEEGNDQSDRESGKNNSGTYEIKKIRDTDADDTSLSNSDLNLED